MAATTSAFLKTMLLAWPGAPDRYFTGSVSDDYTIEYVQCELRLNSLNTFRSFSGVFLIVQNRF